MTQYLLLKSDGKPDDKNVGLTNDSLDGYGVLGGDNYEAAVTSHNGYLELQEANSEYVAIDSFLQSSTITGMTVMAWVRSTDTSGEAIISSYDRSEYYRLNLNGGVFDCSFDTSGGGGDHNSGVNVADGEWHHLVAVYDAGTVRMYVDGRRVYTSTGNATEIGSGGTRYGFLGTGSEAGSFDGVEGPNSYGDLDISDHRLYLDAKTDAEVEAAFEGNPPTAGLHEYLPLTADDAGRLNDASGNGRHGYLRNGAAILGTETATGLSTFQTTNTTNSSPVGQTQASSLLYQQGSVNTSTIGDAMVKIFYPSDELEQVSTSSTALRPKNWWTIAGDWPVDANKLGAVDGFNDVAEFDATMNSGFEDIFTSQFMWADWPAYTGPDKDVYLAFAAKWNEIPNWGGGGSDREWIRQPDADPNNYQLYVLRSTGEDSNFDNDFFRLYYNDSNDIAQGRVADPYVWLDWGNQKWDAQIVGDTFSRTVEPTTQTQSGGTTFGNSLSDTTAGGFTELFTHAEQTADLTTSSVVEAFTESFDIIDHTALGDALSTVTSDTTVATTQTTQSLGNAIAEPLVASEMALLEVENGESFSSAYVDSLETDAFIENTTATSNTAVTSLGQIETSLTEPQFDEALVELFAFVSPKSVSASSVIPSAKTETNINGVIQNTTTVPITPHMDVIIAVRSAQLDIEGKFSDSLSASVGAETFLNVSHTVADTETFDTTERSETLAEVFQTVGNATTTDTIETTSVGAQALKEYAVYSALTSDLFTTSSALSTSGNLNTESVITDADAEALPTATVKEFVLTELNGSAKTDTTVESLATIVQTLVSKGVVESQTDAAAIVSNIVSNSKKSEEYTKVLSKAELEDITIFKRNIRATSEALVESLPSMFNGEDIETEVNTESLAISIVTTALSNSTNGSITAVSTAIGNVKEMSLTPIEALFRILFAAYTGNNVTNVVKSQRTEVMNTNNGVKVINE